MSDPGHSPLVIFGTGGSGTRLVANLAMRAGYDLGARRNVSEDALFVSDFLEAWVPTYLEETDWIREVLAGRDAPAAEDPAIRTALRGAVARHRGEGPVPGGRWGFKAPRCVYVLPLLAEVWPELRGVLVVRDGRDMAYSDNQNQLRKHGGQVLPDVSREEAARPLRSMMLWSRVNRAAARFAEDELGPRFLVLRFEDLCAAPEGTTDRLAEFLGVPRIPGAADLVHPPSSLGRWRERDPDEIRRLETCGRETLTAFGYPLEEAR